MVLRTRRGSLAVPIRVHSLIGPGGDLPPLLAAIAIGLATWRLTSLLVNEDGPWAVVQRLRKLVGITYYPEQDGKPGGVAYTRNPLAGALACFWCLSLYVAPLVILLWWLVPLAVLSLAASAGAIVTEVVIRGRG